MSNNKKVVMPFKIRAMPCGKYFDDAEFTHTNEDVLYVRIANHPVETALKILDEQGYQVSIHAELHSK